MTSETKWFFLGSVLCFAVLGIIMYLSMFWVLFAAAGLLAIGAYVGSASKCKHGKVFKHGVFGGFW